MSSDEKNMNDDHTAQVGPGTQLRIARESRQIPIEEIARRTHISVSRLQALEENRFDVLGPEPFVIGYIRKFAKILEIDSDALVDEYKRLSGIAGQSPAMSGQPTLVLSAGPGLATIARRNITQTIKQIPGWWIVGGAVVIWIIGVYLLVPAENENRPVRPSVEEVEHVERTAPVFPGGDDPAEAEHTVEDPDSMSGRNDTTLAAEPLRAADRTEAPEGNAAPREEAVRPAADPSRAVEHSAAGIPDGQDLLVMNFVEECWVEVNDASGNNIFAALQTPADNLQLFGQAPFTIKLGNARAVSLTINGRTVDTRPQPGRNTLRLTVAP